MLELPLHKQHIELEVGAQIGYTNAALLGEP